MPVKGAKRDGSHWKQVATCHTSCRFYSSFFINGIAFGAACYSPTSNDDVACDSGGAAADGTAPVERVLKLPDRIHHFQHRVRNFVFILYTFFSSHLDLLLVFHLLQCGLSIIIANFRVLLVLLLLLIPGWSGGTRCGGIHAIRQATSNKRIDIFLGTSMADERRPSAAHFMCVYRELQRRIIKINKFLHDISIWTRYLLVLALVEGIHRRLFSSFSACRGLCCCCCCCCCKKRRVLAKNVAYY